MDVHDTITRIIWFLIGVAGVWSFGWIVWNSKIAYYFMLCRMRYGKKSKYGFHHQPEDSDDH